jgi:hypothetical protein
MPASTGDLALVLPAAELVSYGWGKHWCVMHEYIIIIGLTSDGQAARTVITQ